MYEEKAKEKEGYTFTKWSNNETDKEITFNLTGNLEIEPEYKRNKITVKLYTNQTDGDKIENGYTPTGNITLYAHWNNIMAVNLGYSAPDNINCTNAQCMIDYINNLLK